MTSILRRYLGSNPATEKDGVETQRALPASWYTSDNLYELERRAIFSRRWLLISHELRFTRAGDWVRFEVAGFPIFIVRDKTGTINGFHNVCRHRAFPVVTEDKGSSQILACKYHGWSYGLNGKLAKAPGYQDVETFDKSTNGLLSVHIHIDTNGFIWVNFDASKAPMPWSEDFLGADTQERLKKFNLKDYHFDHTWQMSGNYNWKTLGDNYNECYHCSLTHPDSYTLSDLDTYDVLGTRAYIQHFAGTKPEQEEESGIQFVSTYYFPNACMTVTNNFMYMMRCVPTSAHHVSMEYEVYRHNDATDEGFEKIDSMFKRILGEDKVLCNNAQRNLEAGVFINGELHSRKEKGPLFFQSKVREILQEHRKGEEAAKKEIWPARQILPQGTHSQASVEDMMFCDKLDCDKEIAW